MLTHKNGPVPRRRPSWQGTRLCASLYSGLARRHHSEIRHPALFASSWMIYRGVGTITGALHPVSAACRWTLLTMLSCISSQWRSGSKQAHRFLAHFTNLRLYPRWLIQTRCPRFSMIFGYQHLSHRMRQKIC